MILRDIHVHTRYCDGVGSIQDMVLAAMDIGMQTIGFSGHGYTSFDESYCMSQMDSALYREEINAMREKFKGKIEILCGIEQDFYGEKPEKPFDYVIGSVHYVKQHGAYLSVDESAEVFEKHVKIHFDGDAYAFVKAYYKNMEALVDATNADIIGHFDLVTKFNEGNRFFDTEDERYQSVARRALKTLIKTGKTFEVNTGAMARGYKKTPYPDAMFLKEIAKQGGKVILSSDSHSPNTLCYAFSETEKYLRDLQICII